MNGVMKESVNEKNSISYYFVNSGLIFGRTHIAQGSYCKSWLY